MALLTILTQTLTLNELLSLAALFTAVAIFWLLWRTSVEVRFTEMKKDIDQIKQIQLELRTDMKKLLGEPVIKRMPFDKDDTK